MTKPAIVARSLGQSIWLDQIRRDLLTTGEFKRLVGEEGVTGVTSNPTIFEKAISAGDDYDEQLSELARRHVSADEIFEYLAQRDLQGAADVLRPVYDQTNGNDGFVSMEVSPELANDTEATLTEVRRLWALLDRPNILIKIPGTRAGLPAIEQALSEGININITLLFSVARYEQVMEAYFKALERRAQAGQPIDRLRSVASFFVSRVDTLVDKLLAQRPASSEVSALRSKVAIANAKVAYQRFKRTFDGPRWEALVQRGAALQRPLWASTSTKDPSLPDTYYVEALIGPHTVDTVPLATLEAFNDHGKALLTLELGVDEAERTPERLTGVGIDLTAVTDQLEVDGVRLFADSFRELRDGIDAKLARMASPGAEARTRR